MSVEDSSGSSETLFQTPSSTASPATHAEPGGEVEHQELEPSRPEPDVGASPELIGPVTRSGRKRKNLAPVKSSGKKKNKMMPTRSPPSGGGRPLLLGPVNQRMLPRAAPPLTAATTKHKHLPRPRVLLHLHLRTWPPSLPMASRPSRLRWEVWSPD